MCMCYYQCVFKICIIFLHCIILCWHNERCRQIKNETLSLALYNLGKCSRFFTVGTIQVNILKSLHFITFDLGFRPLCTLSLCAQSLFSLLRAISMHTLTRTHAIHSYKYTIWSRLLVIVDYRRTYHARRRLAASVQIISMSIGAPWWERVQGCVCVCWVVPAVWGKNPFRRHLISLVNHIRLAMQHIGIAEGTENVFCQRKIKYLISSVRGGREFIIFLQFYFYTRRTVDLARSKPNSKQGTETITL